MKSFTKKICFCVGVQLNQLLPAFAIITPPRRDNTEQTYKPYRNVKYTSIIKSTNKLKRRSNY